MKIALLTTLFKRPELAACVLYHGIEIRAWCESADHDLTIVLVAVGSEGEESRKLAEEHGWDYVEHENQPLGAKLNAGFARCRALGVDAVVAHGSDDFADPALIVEWARHIEDGASICGLIDMFKVHGRTLVALRWPGYRGARKGEAIGPWRAISRRILDAIDWAPYDPTLSKNLDNSMTKKLNAKCPGWKDTAHVVTMAEAGASAFDVSVPDRITPWELISWQALPAEWPTLASDWLDDNGRAAIEKAGGAMVTGPVLFAPCEAPRLSAAIIVRDMVDTFPATLRSLAGIVDEVCVIVDAASVPETVQIARAAGCKVVIQPWKGYGEQRTDSLRMCRAPWVLVIDADEEIAGGEDIRGQLEQTPDSIDGLAVRMEIGAYQSGEVQTSWSIRVVRRDRAWYEFAEHNELRGVRAAGRCGLVVRTTYAGRSEQSVYEKLDRLMALAAENPTEQHHAFHVAKTLRALGSFQAAAQWAAQCIAIDETTLYAGAAYYELAYASGAGGDLETQDDVLHRATKIHPDHADLWALWVSTTLLRACKAATEPGRFAGLAMTFGLTEAMRAPEVGEMLRLPVRVEMGRREPTGGTMPPCQDPNPSTN